MSATLDRIVGVTNFCGEIQIFSQCEADGEDGCIAELTLTRDNAEKLIVRLSAVLSLPEER